MASEQDLEMQPLKTPTRVVDRAVHSFSHVSVRSYVNTLVPKRNVIDSKENSYNEEFSFCPPPLGMVLFSILQIIAFICDVTTIKEENRFSAIKTVLIYDPHRRIEAWRFLTYMFVHSSVFHLIVNLLVQIMLGFPLEMVHRWWRVSIIYLAGVVAGSLGTSISDPSVYLAGASGGVYAVITAHIATIIMNWKEMRYAIGQLVIFLVFASVDIGTAVYNRYIIKSEESKTNGYAAHFAGAIAGLLVGLFVLRNLEVSEWEKKLSWASLVTFIVLMVAAIIWNAAYPSYFPKQYA